MSIIEKLTSKYHALLSNSEFSKYLKNTSWLFAERVFQMGVGFFVVIYLSRYLGPEKYGLLSYSQSLVGIFVAISTLGIDVILVRELTKNKAKNDVLIGTAITIKFIASLVAMFILFVITFNFEDKEAALLTNVITFILISQSVKTIDTYFQANVISKFSSIANSLSFFLSSAIKLLFIYIEADLVYFAYLLVFDSVVIALGYVTVYSLEKKSVFALKFDYGVASFFVRKGWPLMLVTLAVFIYSKIDQIMIKHLVDNEAVGNYAAAYRISEFAYFIPILFAQSVFPKIVELKQKSEIDYFRFLEKIYKVLVWIGIFISLALFMFSDFIVSVLFGHQYVQASSILSILSFTVVLNSIGVISSKIIYVEHYERKYLYRSILGVLVNIALNYWLIGLYGALGAAISTVITLIVIYYIYDIFDKDLHKFFYLKLQCFIPFNLRKKGMK